MNAPAAPIAGHGGDRRHDAAICAGLVALVLAVFWPVLRNGFVFDDQDYLLSNAHVAQGLTWASARWALTAVEAGFWHPLTWLSHLLDVELYGLWAPGHHATALVLHAANAVVLFLALRHMTRAPWRSAFAAALFAIHPLHVESVAMVAQRKDLLSTLFWFLMLGAYASYARRPRLTAYLATAGCFALGLMAKPMLVTAPFLLLLLDVWPLGRLDSAAAGAWPRALRRLIVEKVPFFALSAAMCVLAYRAEAANGALNASLPYTFPVRAANAVYSYGWYLAKTFWPSHLAAYYPHPGPSIPLGPTAAAAAAIGLISLWALANLDRRPYLLTGWLWYLGTLIPVIGLVQIGNLARADRFTYVPLVGVFLMLGWWIDDDAGRRAVRRQWLALGAAAVLLALGVTARAQVGRWRDAETLWRHALAVTEDNDLANYNLGIALAERGDLAKAEGYFEEMLRINPDYGLVYTSLGRILAGQGRAEEAERYLSMAVQIDPSNVVARSSLAAVLLQRGETPQAVAHLREVARLRPDLSAPQNEPGAAQEKRGEWAEAEESFGRALRADPGDERARQSIDRVRGERRRQRGSSPGRVSP